MKTITFNRKNSYTEILYDLLNGMLRLGEDYLPWLFFKKIYIGKEELQLPRWITKKHMDIIDSYTQKLLYTINWKDVCDKQREKEGKASTM